jgi:RTX calcium-binding nonapeptide repeat (4 copies)
MVSLDETHAVREPYVGPRPFERHESNVFFGREQEVEDLLSLVLAHRTVLLYAASGAGKSSLLNAGLIPRLEAEELEVLPPARVLGTFEAGAPAPAGANVYAAGVLSHWTEDARSGELGSIQAFLAARPRTLDDEGFPAPRVVILDQFEEVFTLHAARWPERALFFDEIREALEADPLLRVLIAIREDYIAHLDPYAPRLPEALRTRFRLEQLRRRQAIAAVEGPLRHTGRRLADGVAEALVDDLLTIRTESTAGPATDARGEFVEPVHLQVACQSLWSGLDAGVSEITEAELRTHGDLDEVLRRFYAEAIEEATRQSRVKEPALRTWVERTLITPGGTRGTVYSETKSTAGLSNVAVAALAEKRLIRSEWRAGAHWYELTHDRLIEPIRSSNRSYFINRGRTRVRRTVLAFTALVVLLSTALGIALATTDVESIVSPAPARDASLTPGETESNVSFRQYLTQVGQPVAGFKRAELARNGNLYSLRIQLLGFRQERVALRWSLRNVDTDEPVPGGRDVLETVLVPDARSLATDQRVWIPLPATAGRYMVSFRIAQRGVPLSVTQLTPFEVTRGVSQVSCTNVGTPGPDVIVGTAGPDVLCGRGGDDVIRGLAGDDVLDGGPGRDRLLGGLGSDQIRARDGKKDFVDGGPGADGATFDAKDDVRGIALFSSAGRFRTTGKFSAATVRG